MAHDFLVDNCGLAVVHVDAPGVDHDFDSDSEGRLGLWICYLLLFVVVDDSDTFTRIHTFLSRRSKERGERLGTLRVPSKKI